MSTWGATAPLCELPRVGGKDRHEDRAPSASVTELERRLSEAESVIRNMGCQIMDLKAAAGHRCIDFGLLKGLLDSVKI